MKKMIFIFIIFMGILFCIYVNNIYANELENLSNKLLKNKAELAKVNLENIDYVKKIIHKMYQIDQEIRSITTDNPKIQDLIEEMDKLHTKKMKEILEIYGWITISKFGKVSDHEAWLLVQHANHDPLFQAGCLFILEYFVNRGETDKKNYAYLYDRVMLNFPNLSMRQKYGTQVEFLENGTISIFPYEGSLQELNERRKEMGLNSIEEYINIMKETYKK